MLAGLLQESPLLLRMLDDASVAMARIVAWQGSHGRVTAAPSIDYLYAFVDSLKSSASVFDHWLKLAVEALGCVSGEMWSVPASSDVPPSFNLCSLFFDAGSDSSDSPARLNAFLAEAGSPLSPSHALCQAAALSQPSQVFPLPGFFSASHISFSHLMRLLVQVWVNSSGIVQPAAHEATFGRLCVGVAVPVLRYLTRRPAPALVGVFVLFWGSDGRLTVPAPQACMDFVSRIASAAAASYHAVVSHGVDAPPPSHEAVCVACISLEWLGIFMLRSLISACAGRAAAGGWRPRALRTAAVWQLACAVGRCARPRLGQ
jgi:hypothetical protein